MAAPRMATVALITMSRMAAEAVVVVAIVDESVVVVAAGVVIVARVANHAIVVAIDEIARVPAIATETDRAIDHAIDRAIAATIVSATRTCVACTLPT
jgi:ribosomal protein L14E/L6E/L27E